MSRRAAVALLATAFLLVAACGGDDADPEASAPTVPPTSTTTTSLPSGAIRLPPLLLTAEDVAPSGFTPVVQARAFDAATASRLLLCGQDVRAELQLVAGRQSRFTDGPVELTHTVTSGGDAAALVERFRRVVEECAAPWQEPPLPTGGGPVRRELNGAYPVPDLGVDAAGAVIRSRNGAGATDTVVVVMVQGPVVSSLSVSGPLGADFSVVDPATEAAASRLLGQSPGSP